LYFDFYRLVFLLNFSEFIWTCSNLKSAKAKRYLNVYWTFSGCLLLPSEASLKCLWFLFSQVWFEMLLNFLIVAENNSGIQTVLQFLNKSYNVKTIVMLFEHHLNSLVNNISEHFDFEQCLCMEAASNCCIQQIDTLVQNILLLCLSNENNIVKTGYKVLLKSDTLLIGLASDKYLSTQIVNLCS
jgi:hypothetical protein